MTTKQEETSRRNEVSADKKYLLAKLPNLDTVHALSLGAKHVKHNMSRLRSNHAHTHTQINKYINKTHCKT